MGSLITAEELHQLIDSGDSGLRILDVRWRLDQPNGHPAYLQGHIPGAVYVDMDSELAAHGRPPTEGRHPLPGIEQLESAARRWGINDGDTVVIYDDANNTSSARAWWLLRHAGVSDLHLLDGSLRSWIEAGLPVDTDDVSAAPGSISLQYGALPALNIDQAAEFPQHGTLLDVRAGERYRGEHEPMDPRAGHIPGALNAPTVQNVDHQGRFLSPEELRDQFIALGVDPERPVASYCGSGIAGTHSIFALELAGFEAALYPGSFSQWSHDGEREVITGDQPG